MVLAFILIAFSGSSVWNDAGDEFRNLNVYFIENNNQITSIPKLVCQKCMWGLMITEITR